MPAWNRNRLTEKLGIECPIIQGPLGALSVIQKIRFFMTRTLIARAADADGSVAVDFDHCLHRNSLTHVELLQRGPQVRM
jgi:hypothetical protein